MDLGGRGRSEGHHVTRVRANFGKEFPGYRSTSGVFDVGVVDGELYGDRVKVTDILLDDFCTENVLGLEIVRVFSGTPFRLKIHEKSKK